MVAGRGVGCRRELAFIFLFALAKLANSHKGCTVPSIPPRPRPRTPLKELSR
jgi:hypothetical protein